MLVLVMQDYKLLVEARLSSLVDVQLAVISRLKREQLTVCKRAARAQSAVDHRVSVTFDQQSFPTKKPISFTVQVHDTATTGHRRRLPGSLGYELHPEKN